MKSAFAGSVLCAVLTIFLTFHGFDVHHADGVMPPPRRFPRRVLNQTENKTFWEANEAYYIAKWKWFNEPRPTKGPDNATGDGDGGGAAAPGGNGTGAGDGTGDPAPPAGPATGPPAPAATAPPP